MSDGNCIASFRLPQDEKAVITYKQIKCNAIMCRDMIALHVIACAVMGLGFQAGSKGSDAG